jgi:cysteine-rich repeat protein
MGFPNLVSYCSKCNETLYIHNATSNLCECRSGKLVGKYCTSEPGCVSTVLSGGQVLCNYCNMFLHYVLDPTNNKCVCAKGFQMDSGGLCKEICGDGIAFTVRCDDGNNIEGDGCSNNCEV